MELGRSINSLLGHAFSVLNFEKVCPLYLIFPGALRQRLMSTAYDDE